jgi:hypothetical protein
MISEPISMQICKRYDYKTMTSALDSTTNCLARVVFNKERETYYEEHEHADQIRQNKKLKV